MIQLTRADGSQVALNGDLVERVETDELTVVTMVDGSRYVVQESTEHVIEQMVAFRASILVAADRMSAHAEQADVPRLRLVSDSKER